MSDNPKDIYAQRGKQSSSVSESSDYRSLSLIKFQQNIVETINLLFGSR